MWMKSVTILFSSTGRSSWMPYAYKKSTAYSKHSPVEEFQAFILRSTVWHIYFLSSHVLFRTFPSLHVVTLSFAQNK
jgi:hypothetical protein